MKVGMLVKALNDAKQKRPEFDYAHLTIKVDGKEVENVDLNLESFSINLSSEAYKEDSRKEEEDAPI